MHNLPEALAPLAAWPQFVCWRAEPDGDRPGKMKKLPLDWRTGRMSSAHDSSIWTDANTALANHLRFNVGYGSGAGFVFTANDPFFFLDMDDAYHPATVDANGAETAPGFWSPLAVELCQRLAGAAVEVSQSHKGLHLFGCTSPLTHGTKNTTLEHTIELYTSGRFVALTGLSTSGDASSDHTAALQAIAAQYFPATVATMVGDWTTAPVPEWEGPEDDDDLIRIMLRSAGKSAAVAFGGKQSFVDLWEGRIDPDKRSESDGALAAHLAFWTGKDCERIERLMRRSALLRDKWDSASHSGYLATTITKACGVVQKVAKLTAPVAPNNIPPVPGMVTVSAPGEREGNEFVWPNVQTQLFNGCYYVEETHQIFSIPHNSVLDKKRFDVRYGGYRYVMDRTGAKMTESAWDAFTLNRVNICPIVDTLCFRPELPVGQLVTEGNHVALNSYIPYECPSAPGDVTPFLDWLGRVLPIESDRASLMAYLASFSQNPGVKFQWWPVVQGAQGNGKTMLMEIMTHIAGQHYTHLPNPHQMARDGMKFNGWIDRKLFIGIEEVMLSKRRDFLEEFKVVVTNKRIPIEKKNVDGANTDNRVNGLILTNHTDGVPIDTDTRRYAIYFTAQQLPGDVERSGMGGMYFPHLYDWLRGEKTCAGRVPGVHHIAAWLKAYIIPVELDPAGAMHRAPNTSSTAAAIVRSYGYAEQEIAEAIAEGRVGFAGGWVSSRYLTNLLEHIRVNVPLNKRRDLMRTLGYDWHPGLNDGRVNNKVMPDNGKPRLFVLKGSEAEGLRGPAEIERGYTMAQEAVLAEMAITAGINIAQFQAKTPAR